MCVGYNGIIPDPHVFEYASPNLRGVRHFQYNPLRIFSFCFLIGSPLRGVYESQVKMCMHDVPSHAVHVWHSKIMGHVNFSRQ